MGFVRSMEKIVETYRETGEFYDAEMLTVMWETEPEVVERLTPPPLRPATRPIAVAFVANYPKTNFGVSYLESSLLLMVEFEGEKGMYCLSMTVTNDMAMAAGREIYGYPKKLGNIRVTRKADEVEGIAERHGVRFCDLRARLTGKFNTKDAEEIFSEVLGRGSKRVGVIFNFKHFPAPDGLGFDYNPRLIKGEVEFHPTSIEFGEAEVIVRPSEHDPWVDVKIQRVLGAMYTVGNSSMKKGRVVAEADPMEFAEYAFLKWDLP